MYERDNETDLDFAQARYYNKNHGRFSSPDPLLASAESGNPQTWNRYIYSLNTPLVFVDPTGEDPRTDTDREGNVYSVTEDGDLGVYRHDDISPNGDVDTNACGDNCVERVGETATSDEFLDHNEETGATLSNVAPGAKIYFGTSFDGDITNLNNEAKNSTLGAIEVAYQSTGGQKYDIKTNTTIAPSGINTGRLLDGKYATARSAGNYLAGLNGATTPVITAKVIRIPFLPIPPIPWGTKKTYLDETQYMKIAGGLQQGGRAGAIAAAAGKSYGSPPYYGELELAGRRISAGFQRGLRERK